MKTKHTKFSEKRTFFTLDTLTQVCVLGGKKCSFFRKFGMSCFLETPVLRCNLLPCYWRFTKKMQFYMVIVSKIFFNCLRTCFIHIMWEKPFQSYNPLWTSPQKLSNTLKKFVDCCLSVFDHFAGLAIEGLTMKTQEQKSHLSILQFAKERVVQMRLSDNLLMKLDFHK